jgi:hypothetical protein
VCFVIIPWKFVKEVSLSNFTVSRIIDSMDCSTGRELNKRIGAVGGFPTQVDETTDFAGHPALFPSVRYMHIRIKLRSGRCHNKHLSILTTDEDTFNLTDLYEPEIFWKQCVDICTDVVGKTRGFVAPVKAIALECTRSHIIVHRHAVA